MKNTQKHTQGPWTVSNGLPTVWANNGERQIADCDKGPLRSTGEDLANAQLIAAAPDLLSVAKALMEFADGNNRLNLTGKLAESVGLARAAIAKAEGNA